MKKLIVLAAVALMLVVGCSKKADYYPLTVGNIWEYTTTTTVTNTDTTIMHDTTYTSTSKSEVTAEVTLDNGDAGFEMVNTSGTFVDTSYASEKDGCILGYDALDDATPDTMLVTPVEEGTTWIAYSDSTGSVRVTIQEKVNGIVVPAGTYDDVWKGIAISTFGAYVDTSYGWMAPNIGDIKHEATNITVILTDTMTTTVTTELEDVTIK
jgi:major membrane immunogen (membrane-anchored lipoprotein)